MFVLLPIATLLTLLLTILIRKNAIQKNQLDIPNERSSHTAPTPRGAGVAVATVFIVGLLALRVAEKISDETFISIALPGFFVAIIGRLDDLGYLTSAKWRLVGHFLVAIVAVWLVGGLPSLPIANSSIDFGMAGNVLAVIYLVWMLNLFNFMDGIDLITGVETITASGATAIFLANKADGDFWLVPAILAATVLGFMFLNIPPAKIFLGDVGSGFIGFVIAVISLVTADENVLIAWAMVILLAVFISDSTVTLLRRIIKREHLYVAHRTHAYQNLTKRVNKHLSVSLGVGATNLFWLLPIAWLVANESVMPIVGVTIAYIPVIALALFLKAGKQTVN
jgi:Fuc2NAc and GlcNAc transferase